MTIDSNQIKRKMDKTKRQFAGVIFNLIMQNLQKMWHIEMEEDSDDEEENVILLHMMTSMKEVASPKNNNNNYVEHTVANYSEQEFQLHFRLSYAAFEDLERRLGPEIGPHSLNVSVRKQLLLTLWLLATPDSFRSVGVQFNMSKSRIYHCFNRIINLLNSIAKNVIKWPLQNSKIKIKEDFANIGGLKNVIGVIDGTIVEIKEPNENAPVHKCGNLYAMHLQAIAVVDLKFINVFIGYPGSVNNRQVFQNSDIYKYIYADEEKYFAPGECILGDEEYPEMTWCKPPLKNRETLTHSQKNFNNAHTKTRQVVEEAFALLFGRYRRLKYLDMSKTKLTPVTIMAVCVLHNICLNHSNQDFNKEAIAEGKSYMESRQQRLLEDSD